MAYDSDQRIMVAIFSIEDIDIQLLGGVSNGRFTADWSTWNNTNYLDNFKEWVENASRSCYIGILNAGWVAMVFGLKYNDTNYIFFIARTAIRNDSIKVFCHYDSTSGDIVFDNPAG